MGGAIRRNLTWLREDRLVLRDGIHTLPAVVRNKGLYGGFDSREQLLQHLQALASDLARSASKEFRSALQLTQLAALNFLLLLGMLANGLEFGLRSRLVSQLRRLRNAFFPLK